MENVEKWGTGTPTREFLYVDDMADACVFLMNNYDGEQHVNIGTGEEITIKDLALFIKEIVNYNGKIIFNHKMKGGTPRKVCDINKLKMLGWKKKVELRDGIEKTYNWYKNNIK